MCHRALSYTLSWLLCLKSHWDGGISLLVPIFLTLPRFCMHVHCLMLQFFKIFVIHQNHNYTGRGSSNCIPESYLPAFLVSALSPFTPLLPFASHANEHKHHHLYYMRLYAFVCLCYVYVCACVHILVLSLYVYMRRGYVYLSLSPPFPCYA